MTDENTRPPDWEHVFGIDYDLTERMPVPGGWLYRNIKGVDGHNVGDTDWFVTTAFVPLQPPADYRKQLYEAEKKATDAGPRIVSGEAQIAQTMTPNYHRLKDVESALARRAPPTDATFDAQMELMRSAYVALCTLVGPSNVSDFVRQIARSFAVIVTKPDGSAFTVADCAALSRAVSGGAVRDYKTVTIADADTDISAAESSDSKEVKRLRAWLEWVHEDYQAVLRHSPDSRARISAHLCMRALSGEPPPSVCERTPT